MNSNTCVNISLNYMISEKKNIEKLITERSSPEKRQTNVRAGKGAWSSSFV